MGLRGKIIRWVAAALGAAAVCVAVAWGVGLLLDVRPPRSAYATGCGKVDYELRDELRALPVFDRQPAGARAFGGSTGCEPDDRTATASRSYAFAGAPAEVFAFYRDLAVQDGWTPEAQLTDSRRLAFTKGYRGTRIRLTVSWSSSAGEPQYGVTVEGSLPAGSPD
ncbi:hypothetical protein [Streptomyces sp. NRRL B-24484]|uniref:hypothetical protein n=1 Tax=Streptomyces sp. NRRL B-24484 TaxID=1463833 RepID=UPI000694BF89|nr:hypothetical protein [Streptomyces sp. NRRL B-24484]